MAGSLDEQVRAVNELKALMKKNDLKGCEALLNKLKIALTQYAFLPSTEGASKKELLIARETLELGAQWSIKSGNVEAFERYISQLKVYYFDFGESLVESAYMHELLGLNLLCLLSQNRIGEFHTELERLDPKDLSEKVYFRHPVALEQYLMEGSYNKIFLSRGNVPADSYSFFIDELVHTIREEIAGGFEKAYGDSGLPQAEAARLLFLQDPKEVTTIAETRGWKVVGSNYEFPAPEAASKTVPAPDLIERSLSYALELEKIV